jgi:hypothetical protein
VRYRVAGIEFASERIPPYLHHESGPKALAEPFPGAAPVARTETKRTITLPPRAVIQTSQPTYFHRLLLMVEASGWI